MEEVASWSVREMKTLLRRNFVDYKGCCERWELEERVRRLYEDTQRLQAGACASVRIVWHCMHGIGV